MKTWDEVKCLARVSLRVNSRSIPLSNVSYFILNLSRLDFKTSIPNLRKWYFVLENSLKTQWEVWSKFEWLFKIRKLRPLKQRHSIWRSLASLHFQLKFKTQIPCLSPLLIFLFLLLSSFLCFLRTALVFLLCILYSLLYQSSPSLRRLSRLDEFHPSSGCP